MSSVHSVPTECAVWASSPEKTSTPDNLIRSLLTFHSDHKCVFFHLRWVPRNCHEFRVFCWEPDKFGKQTSLKCSLALASYLIEVLDHNRDLFYWQGVHPFMHLWRSCFTFSILRCCLPCLWSSGYFCWGRWCPLTWPWSWGSRQTGPKPLLPPGEVMDGLLSLEIGLWPVHLGWADYGLVRELNTGSWTDFGLVRAILVQAHNSFTGTPLNSKTTLKIHEAPIVRTYFI